MEKMSETLQRRIEETRGEILALEARLVAVLEEKQATLGADKINVNSLATLEAEEVKIPATLASLHTRVSLLSEQIGETLRAEAVERSSAIEQELADINAGLTDRYHAFLTLVGQQLELIEADYPARQKRAELRAEARYLHEKYTAPYPQVSDAKVLSSKDIVKLEAAFTKFWGLLHVGGFWQERTNEILQQRARDERAALTGQSRLVTVNTATFSLGVKA
jgi:hypothetical protein